MVEIASTMPYAITRGPKVLPRLAPGGRSATRVSRAAKIRGPAIALRAEPSSTSTHPRMRLCCSGPTCRQQNASVSFVDDGGKSLSGSHRGLRISLRDGGRWPRIRPVRLDGQGFGEEDGSGRERSRTARWATSTELPGSSEKGAGGAPGGVISRRCRRVSASRRKRGEPRSADSGRLGHGSSGKQDGSKGTGPALNIHGACHSVTSLSGCARSNHLSRCRTAAVRRRGTGAGGAYAGVEGSGDPMGVR